MAKKVVGQIKLQIPAGQANPAPPVGPALGQQGVNIMASPPASALLKKAAGVASGSKVPNKDKVGKVTRQQVLDIVKIKAKDLNSSDEAAGYRIVAGTARSMGIDVVG